MALPEFLTFPNPVNEKAARVVAGGVVALGVLTLLTQQWWLAAVLAAGFALRVAAGPRFSPLGRLAVHAVAPLFGAAVAALGFGATGLASVLIGVLVVFATLESALGFCAGCWAFGHLMRLGVIPDDTCAACNDITLRQPQRTPEPQPQGTPA